MMKAELKTDGLKATRRLIEKWRNERTKLGPMPCELWNSAVALARKHGVGPVARGLGLGHASLKSRLETAERTSAGRQGQHTIEEAGNDHRDFVEVFGPSIAAAGGNGTVVVEVSAPSGARLSIHLPYGNCVDVVGLVKCFGEGP